MENENTDMSIKYEILWKFIGNGKISAEAVLSLLELFAGQKIGVGTYNLILRFVSPKHILENEKIAQLLTQLSEDENGYVRNLTKRKLDEK
jgi:hypothetical protein